ncbi:MAG TPA: BON domain-containing protein [Candidatus Angelobacter sp.]|nr:BON domain-containing protein [Candidatus Angelobacter sp.]
MRGSLLPIATIGRRLRQWIFAASLVGFAAAPMTAQLPQTSSTDQNARNTKPLHDQKATRDVAEKLEKAFDPRNAAYAGSAIKSVVDDQTVTLNGTVKDEGQHEMALQLARAYAGNRKIVDRLTIQP